jgi:8-oxo-dGTP pyrophosphatase MutT (NUDIX family)
MDALFKLDPQSTSSKGLVFIGSKMLVIRRGANAPTYPLKADLPGGGQEPGETPFATFKREVKEEVGLDISDTDIV